jgi:hypothetical protein
MICQTGVNKSPTRTVNLDVIVTGCLARSPKVETKGQIPPDPGLRKRVTRTRAHGTGQAMQSSDLATILPFKSDPFLAT